MIQMSWVVVRMVRTVVRVVLLVGLRISLVEIVDSVGMMLV